MQGSILEIDYNHKYGIIVDKTGKRYSFSYDLWQENHPPQQGETVFFQINNGAVSALSSATKKKNKSFVPFQFEKVILPQPLMQSMTFNDALKICFKKFIIINGRATRSEFWFFQLFVALFMAIIGGISLILPLIAPVIGFIIDSILFFMTIFLGLILIIPAISVYIRRLHDRNVSGWWLAIIFILSLIATACSFGNILWIHLSVIFSALSSIGYSFLFVMTVLPSQRKANKYGPDSFPKQTLLS